MSNSRDDFTQSTINILRERVAYKCSNPDCRIVTSGPSTDKDKVNRIGEAAHISAAAKGGPRYDANMTSDERKAIDNGIWLCSNCADMTDKDWKRYPIELLHQWKENAEELALKEMGKKLPTIDEPVELLMASITGEGLKSFPSRLENISLAASRYLEEADPRFTVNIAFDKNYTTFHFSAKKEPVEMKLSITPKDVEDFNKKMENLFKYGESLETTVNDFSLDGSEIFDKLKQNNLADAKISFVPKSVDAKLKLILTREQDKDYIDDMIGLIYAGENNFTFQGELFNGILGFRIRSPFIIGAQTSESSFNFKMNVEIWNEMDITALPYFNKAYDFFKKLYLGYSLGGIMEIEGEKLLSLQDKILMPDSSIIEMYSIFRYVYLARKISQYFDEQIIFDKFEFYYDDLKEMESIVHAIENYSVKLKKDDSLKFSIIITSDEHLNNLRNLSMNTKPIQMKIKAPSHNLNIFKKEIKIPQIRQVFTHIKLNESPNYDSKKVGDSIEFEYIAEKDSFYSIEFIEKS